MPKRDWKRINEALVRRGELLLDLDFVKGWGDELEGMNTGKEGAKFRYPDSFIHFLLSCMSICICLTGSWKGSRKP